MVRLDNWLIPVLSKKEREVGERLEKVEGDSSNSIYDTWKFDNFFSMKLEYNHLIDYSYVWSMGIKFPVNKMDKL